VLAALSPPRPASRETRGALHTARCAAGRLVVVVTWLSWAIGCGPRLSEGGSGTHPNTPLARQLDSHLDSRRPSLATLTREGDPAAGLAVTIAHEGDCATLAALGQVLLARLSAASVDAFAEISPGGLSVSMLAESPELARLRFTLLDRSLRRPLEARELTRASSSSRVAPLRFASSMRACDSVPASGQPPLTALEGARSAMMVRERVAFAVVGGPHWVDALESLAPSLESWPSGTPAPTAFPPTELRSVRADSSTDLTLQIRSGSLESLVEAGELLGDGALENALRVQHEEARLSRLELFPQLFGGTLELEIDGLGPEKAEPLLSERLLAVVLRDAAWALEHSAVQGALPARVVKEHDPRRAAIWAAWALLSRPREMPATFSSVMHLSPEESVPQGLAARYKQLAARPMLVAPEPLLQLEHGQANLFALLGTRCPADEEGSGLAGATALVLETLARSYDGTDGVRLQALTGAPGSVLLASASSRRSDSSDLDVARRLGQVLGTVMARKPLLPQTLETARGDLLASLGGTPRPALWTALETLAPSQPGALAPRGTYPSLLRLDHAAVASRRRQLLSGGLSLAVLAHSRPEQAKVLASTLARHLPVGAFPAQGCRSPSPILPGKTRLMLSGPRADLAEPILTVAIDLGVTHPEEAPFAEWLTWLMDRENGWLTEALGSGLLRGRPRATLTGSGQRRALVLLVPCAARDAELVMGTLEDWFDELPTSTYLASAAVDAARDHFARAQVERRLDPAQRLLEFWSRSPGLAVPTRSTFPDYVRRAFSTPRMVSVVRQPDGSVERDR